MSTVLKYMDLFCGIGGFHQGIEKSIAKSKLYSRAKCVFAADNDKTVAEVYKRTYGIPSYYDLTDNNVHKLIKNCVSKNGNIDLICAGFPCQSFSKAGNREGFKNKTKGTLFFEVARIIEYVKPKYVLLENVRNLKGHDGGKTWKTIQSTMEELGYDVDHQIVSPNCFGIPALRERILIMCYRKNLNVNKGGFHNGERRAPTETSIYRNGKLDKKYFSSKPSNLSKEQMRVLALYEELNIKLQKKGKRLYSPMWTRYYFNNNEDISHEPIWKQILIEKNKRFYKDNKKLIDDWKSKNTKVWETLNDTCKKFEWNAGEEINSIWDGIIQFRPSGIRVKRPDYMPTFVAINQTPIIGAEKRYITPDEMAKLYGFKNVKFGNEINQTYKQLGNTVSVTVIEEVFTEMLRNTNKGRI